MEELLGPRHTALLVIDMQNDFCSPGGIYDRMGHPVASLQPEVIDTIGRLIRAARNAGAMLVYVQNTNLPDQRSTSAPYIRYRAVRRRYGYQAESTVIGTWGWQIAAGLAGDDQDLVVRKHRSSAFAGTDLDQLLRLRRIETVALCGVTTDGCVESTARAAEALDYYVVPVEDACGAFPVERHLASMACMGHRYDVLSAKDLLRVWHGGREAAAG
jgi:nicotinamidase-related amidase